MKHIVSFSGGRSSRLLVHLMEIKRKEENLDVEYIFMDTGAEHPKTYEFIRNIVEFYGIELNCLRAKFGPFGVGTSYTQLSVGDIGYDLDAVWKPMIEKYSTPHNPGGGFCTMHMKNLPCLAYIKDKYPNEEITQWWGIRADEPKRLKDKGGIRYLAELTSFEKEDVLEWSYQQEVDLDLEHSDITGNCVFCIKRSNLKVALAARYEPELATDFINLTEHPDVRVSTSDARCMSLPEEMYRGEMSLRDIIKAFEEHSNDDIEQRLKLSKRYDSGSCSESCEALNADMDSLTDQMLEELSWVDL